ncbi:lycopene beta-cyclase CrtY [Jiella sp. MQZ9-1]|uniref:Lycopene beta-cyclase CrtY n=1 Tax=Jiella flava TaxID=2816857 RepID=A0A939G245_9HYPH|nr:lycopene beta-cyclase CrtY [Jiella flava]MBO0663674.1 lycopene beta-cyclase CrtY [Jiella flava]MCD2472247.1 lycopene beta-cyclase CrtY [Jiella flava]
MVERDGLDIAFVGGGLANGLIAWRLAQARPDLTIAIFEAGPALGGNHTWSFHAGDLTAAEHAWMQPFISYAWDDNEVRFPNRRKHLGTGYCSVTSERFREVLASRLAGRIHCKAFVRAVTPTALEFEAGPPVTAGAVIDGRGHAESPHMRLGFQKFLGQEIAMTAPHGVARPVIMDATVPQSDGYRFVYLLPLTATRLLIEDTYYADGADLDRARLAASIAAYVAAHGWQAAEILREEEGILPIAIDGDIAAFWADKQGVAASGLAAGLFHPTTGYSLPDAVKLADRLAALRDHSAATLFAETRAHSIATWKARGFFRMLNRLLYFAGDASQRYRILEHFYRLDAPLVARFYAARLKTRDKLRILTGKPPVPFGNAIRVLARHRLTGELA